MSLSLVILCEPYTGSDPPDTHITDRTNYVRGGKVAMTVALSPKLPDDAIDHLIIADIAPSSASLSTEFGGYIEAMNKIEQSRVNSRREAQAILAPYEPVCHLLHNRRHLPP
jgi:hypothetical protein